VSRRATFTLVVLAAAVALISFAVVRTLLPSREEPAEAPPTENVPSEPPGSEPTADVAPETADAVMRHLNVLIYFPSSEGEGLDGEPREIFMTAAPGDRAKQILADLIAGPDQATRLRSIPRGTRLRQVYVLENGTAYVDFSADLRQGMGGGSTGELLTVYSIVNSVVLNIPEIRRVGILIEGRPVETLNGHIDLSRPLPPNLSLLVPPV
jgi:spore germination protein GerM